jgi:hypothetical protein
MVVTASHLSRRSLIGLAVGQAGTTAATSGGAYGKVLPLAATTDPQGDSMNRTAHHGIPRPAALGRLVALPAALSCGALLLTGCSGPGSSPSQAASRQVTGGVPTGPILSDGDKEVCSVAYRATYVDVNAVAGLATNAAIKQQLQRINVTASDTTASEDAVVQIRRICAAAGWQAQSGSQTTAAQLSPLLPSQTITGVTDTFSCQLLPSISQVLPTIGSLTNESGQKYVFTTAVRGDVSTDGFVVDTDQQLNNSVGRFQLSTYAFKDGDPCYLIAIPFDPSAFRSEGTTPIGVGEMKGAVIIDKATVTTVTG